MTDEQKTKRYKSAFTKLGVEYPFEFKDETKLSAEERVIYQRKLRDYRDYKNMIDCAWEEGYRQGLEEMKQLNADLNKS